MSARFFATLARYLNDERPTDVSTDAVFVVLKGPHRGRPLSGFGLDEIMRGARRRAGLTTVQRALFNLLEQDEQSHHRRG